MNPLLLVICHYIDINIKEFNISQIQIFRYLFITELRKTIIKLLAFESTLKY